MRRRTTKAAGSMALLLGVAAAFADGNPSGKTLHVSGTGTDLLNAAVVHSKRTTPDGEIQRSTEIVDLEGDLKGKVLYHVTTVIDTKTNTLVNTGDQVFSGTIGDSEPVMLHDSKFRFVVNLATGAERGSVSLLDHIAGPRVRCELQVTGTGKDTNANPTFRYAGTCKFERPERIAATLELRRRFSAPGAIQKTADDRVQPLRAPRERRVIGSGQHAQLGVGQGMKYLERVLERDCITIA
jgi:hypothetical protein